MKKEDEYIEYENGKRILLDSSDTPELTEEFFKKAKSGKKALENIFGKKDALELMQGKITLKPLGRPKKNITKVKTTFRLDRNIIDEFRLYGKGWQTMVNTALHEWLDNRPQQ